MNDRVKWVLHAALANRQTVTLFGRFFGMMANGAHDQPHHFGITTGQMTH